jgi:hypothetical protein
VRGDTRADQEGRRDTPSSVAALSLRSVHTRRVRNGPEQPGTRPKPSRSQPELGSAGPRSGCRDGAIRRILGSGYHRNAGKQFERGVSPNVIVSLRERPAQTVAFRDIVRRLEFWHRRQFSTETARLSFQDEETTRADPSEYARLGCATGRTSAAVFNFSSAPRLRRLAAQSAPNLRTRGRDSPAR